MAARYTAEQIQQALEAGLLSQQDAEYLMQALEPGANYGGLAGGALGALGGAALGGMAGAKLGGKFAANTVMDSPAATLGAGAVGAGLGGWGGAEAGEAMMPPSEGEGVEGQAGVNPYTGEKIMERDFVLRALMDPKIPADTKKELFKMLQAYDTENPPAEMGYGAGVPWGALLGTLAGGGAGAALGAKFGPKMAGMMKGQQTDVGSWGDDFSNLMARNGDVMGGLAGGAVGAGAGGMAGSMMAPASASPYEDPYGGA